jgi:MerR family copper efflux transcriptional regulator
MRYSLNVKLLLQPPSNYRYYDYSSIERLNFIEKYKEEGMSLDEIKKEIIEKKAEEIDVLELRMKIKELEKDVSKILTEFEKSDLKNCEYVKKIFHMKVCH